MRTRFVTLLVVSTMGLEGVASADEPKTVWEEKIDVEASNVVRADFTTQTEPVGVERVACALGARAQIDGADRPLEMRVEYEGKIVLCPTGGPNGFTVVVRIDPAPKQTFHVLLQADPPRPEARTDLDQTLHEVSAEIERRARGVVVPKVETRPPEIHARPTRAFSPALTVTGIVVAGLGFASLGIGYFWLAGESASARDLAPPIAVMLGGGGGILMGALFALVGEHRVPADQTSGTIIPGGFRF